MRKYLFIVCLIFSTNIIMSQNQSFGQDTTATSSKNHFGLAIKGGTWGYGGDIIWSFHPKFDIRLGGTHSTAKLNQVEGDLSVDHDYKLTQFNLLADYNLNSWMHLTAGIIYSLENEENAVAISIKSVDFGEVTVSPERLGTIVSTTTWNRVAPYIGLGFGRTISPNKVVGFTVEFGTFYMGKPTVKMNGTGMIGPTANEQNSNQLSENMSEIQFFPVLNFSLSFRIK